MKYAHSFTRELSIFVEALEPRIAPAGLLNEAKFTTITLGTPQLLDASGGPNSFQGLTTGSGPNGEYLLYITSGKALVFTSDIAGNGKYEPGDITGIAAGVDGNGQPLNLILFTDVHGDIVTDLLPGAGVSQLTDSDNNPANGRDGRVLLDDGIGSITLRTLTSADLDPTIPGDTVANRLALTHFSIYGNIYCGGDFGGLTIDTTGEPLLAAKFNGTTGDELFTTADPTIGDIYTGSAASNQPFHFTQLSGTAAFQGTLVPFTPAAGEHGGDISNIQAAIPGTIFNIGTIETGNGGFGARGGDISDVTLHTDGGAYQLIAGDGGEGPVGAPGGSIVDFSDLGSSTGEVLLHTGSGGVGLLGDGGAGGTATFGTVSIAAGVDVFLGHGGNGFTGGGDGAGLPSATFTVPEGSIPIGGQFVGTYHAIGDVGDTFQLANGTYSPQVIDFTGNGFGDGVFTTTNPDQLVVVFGDGVHSLVDSQGNPNSALASETVRLTAPGPITSFVVGDFNGDGKPDIAVASADPGNSGGVEVFLNQIGNPTLDPLGAANFTRNPLGAHPFSTPLQSAIPTLTDFGFFAGTGGILALAAGDFNGDGIMDLAYVEQVNLIAPPVNPLWEAVGILFGSAVRDPNTGAVVTNPVTGHPEGSGYFYANPSAQTAAPTLQVAFFNTMAVPVLRATSLTSTNVPLGSTTGIPTNPEVLLLGLRGVDGTVGDALSVLTPNVNFEGLTNTIIGLGKVDTNRTLGATDISLSDVTLQDFTIQDINGDGDADISLLAQTPAQFLVTLEGNGTGGFTIRSGDASDNAGIFLNSTFATAISPVDADSSGTFNDIAILGFGSLTGAGGSNIIEFKVGQPGNGNAGFVTSANINGFGESVVDTLVGDQTIVAFDTFYEQAETTANPHPVTGFGVLTPNSTANGDSFLQIYANASGLIPFAVYETNNGFRIYSGDGGNSTVGAGGDAGALGNGMLTASTTGAALGSISIVFPAYEAYQGNSFLSGGRGGNGFTSGGVGGDVTGISATYAPAATVLSSTIQLKAGNGGDGVSGDGGRGGMLSAFSLTTGTFFSAGDGGSGLAGGAGGSVLGNQQGVYDTSSSNVTVVTGSGGTGAIGGGAGGDIDDFDAVFPPLIGSGTGFLSYVTGKGGSTAGGVGGNGGSITDSSPDSGVNNLGGDVTLSTGAGGDGLTGGMGGSITNFVNSPTGTVIPTRLDVLTGNGGIGISSTGGAGGSISNFQSDATGLENGEFSALSGIVRVLAGNGGASYASTGGMGGTIMNSTVEATSTPVVVAAGAGGDGLMVGGAGGAVLNSVISSAAQAFGKMLVVAGDGGDATAVTKASVVIPGDPNTNDLAHALLAFGGADGVGGNGGDITGLTQPTGVQTAVDLIGGNGGSTINSGSAVEAVTGVGMGGSITDVNLAGTVGSITRNLVTGSNPPIKSYTDLTGTGVDAVSTAVFLQTELNGIVSVAQTSDFEHDFIPNDPSFMLDDAAGNVGIVAGRAGFVKGGQGASDGINGSVENISATSFLSVIAGSVNNVAPVQVLSGITVTNPDGVLGADKSLPTSTTAGGPNSQLDYYNSAGKDVQNLQPGDRLIDGALFAITINQPAAAPFISGPRVFSINNG
jgi:hypothetical protein